MLTLDQVRKSYSTTLAVDGLTLEVRKGEVFGLLGPNGAGKSTTVAMAVGLFPPDSGTVSIQELGNPREPAVRAKIGVAPQALAIYEDFSGEENLHFFGQIQGLQGAKLKERVTHALAFVGLTERRRQRVSAYSGGMKRRLNLAVAVVNDPPLLLLDEPTVGVDPQSRMAIFENILALKREGCTVLYTTHYMEEAERLCDRVAIMDHGKLLALDTVPGLIAAHGGKGAVFVEHQGGETRIDGADPLTELVRMHQAGKATGFRMERPSLETVFLELTGRTLRDS